VKESGKGETETRRKEVEKTESGSQLSVSRSCLKGGGKEWDTEGKERRQRPGERKWERGDRDKGGKEMGKTESVRQLSVSHPCLKWVGREGLIVVKTIVNT
jgi:hypothetical protein